MGDLGIQKNLVLWYSAAESTKPLKIHPAKLAEQPREQTPPPVTSSYFTTPIKPVVKLEAYPTPISPVSMSKSSSEVGGEMVFPVTSNGLTPAVLKARLTQKLKYVFRTSLREHDSDIMEQGKDLSHSDRNARVDGELETVSQCRLLLSLVNSGWRRLVAILVAIS